MYGVVAIGLTTKHCQWHCTHMPSCRAFPLSGAPAVGAPPTQLPADWLYMSALPLAFIHACPLMYACWFPGCCCWHSSTCCACCLSAHGCTLSLPVCCAGLKCVFDCMPFNSLLRGAAPEPNPVVPADTPTLGASRGMCKEVQMLLAVSVSVGSVLVHIYISCLLACFCLRGRLGPRHVCAEHAAMVVLSPLPMPQSMLLLRHRQM